MYKSLALKLLVSAIIIYAIGCGDKKDDKTTNAKQDSIVSSLITKDSVTGKDQVQLKYIVSQGDTFRYKMVAKTSNTENSPATEGKEIRQDNEINYYYTKVAENVEASGIITYKVFYDSISLTSQMDEQLVKFNSNVNDSVKNNPAFIQYNAVIREPFYIRVSSAGEITDVYGLEKIHENLFKALGDTLNEADKMTIKESFGKESVKEVLQQEYQIFPPYAVDVDSSWIKSYTTQIMFFEVVNSARYTLKNLEDIEGKKTAVIEANLVVEFLNKEIKERGIKFTIEKSETSGYGKISFDMSRGCIANKETSTTLNLDLRMSAQGQSAKSEQKVITNMTVTLLN